MKYFDYFASHGRDLVLDILGLQFTVSMGYQYVCVCMLKGLDLHENFSLEGSVYMSLSMDGSQFTG